ncbi:hypothetical protein tb265_10410 [Gemmatimonadetes bacterium T265]|nr:hypothetical protein tb265_10410 [Gemmatimonadetes bacterium T265]
MDRAVVEQYLARAAAAASVRELHALARAVRQAHEGDPDAERVEQACWAAALRVVAEASGARPAFERPPSERPPYDRREAPRAFAGPDRRRVDWKERAART